MFRPMSIFLFVLALASISCSKQATTDGDSTGGSGPWTAANIAKSWTSDCTAMTDSRLGTSYYKNLMTLNSDGSFMFQQYLHTGSGGSNCNNANYVVVFTLYGTYAVGAVTSGSMQSITFNVTTTGGSAPDLMIENDWNSTPSVSAIETAFNTDCGGTSPYCTLSGGTCTLNPVASGAHSASKSMSCMNYQFPNTGTNMIYNVGTYDGSTLTLGSGVTGVPGVFSSGSTPTSPTVAYH